jgi:hypothetical protein
MDTSAAAPGPGFYPDPSDSAVNRYWDGSAWTDSRESRAPTTSTPDKQQNADGTIIAGYVLAILMPLIGFIIGLTQINRNRHGIWVVVVSIAAFFIWLSIIASGSSGGSASSTYTILSPFVS